MNRPCDPLQSRISALEGEREEFCKDLGLPSDRANLPKRDTEACRRFQNCFAILAALEHDGAGA